MSPKIEQFTLPADIVAIMKKCDICHIALFDDPYPYIIPINFGVVQNENTLTLYFNSKKRGKKDELIAKNHNASFVMDCNHVPVPGNSFCESFVAFESVIGSGFIEEVTDIAEKQIALNALSKQLIPGQQMTFQQDCSEQAIISKMKITSVTGIKKEA